MKIEVCRLLLTLGIFTSCETENTIDSIEGNWSYINPVDSSYTELYCTKEFLVLNIEHAGVLGVQRYYVRDNTVFSSDGDVMFEILESDGDSTIVVLNHQEQPMKLQRLQVPVLMDFCIPDSKKVELQTGRFLRDPSYVDADTLNSAELVLQIPPPEQ